MTQQPQAAVPSYLGSVAYKEASPAMRFGLYFQGWDQQWGKVNLTLSQWQAMTVWNEQDQRIMKAWCERQQQLASSLSAQQMLLIQAQAIAPFATGLGNEHPTENGFAFLQPYGLPYLAGSGVKGVLRQAVRELLGDWAEVDAGGQNWSQERKPVVLVNGKEKQLREVDILFGLESQDRDTEHFRGVLQFWDVLPQLAGNGLRVDVMTPHYSHYYQNSKDKNSGNSASPHDSGQPIPIYFLTVPPQSTFQFCVRCDIQRLQSLKGHALLTESDGQPLWQVLVQSAFAHAFAWLGFGAKTAVGYGHMRRNREAEEKMQTQLAEQKAATKRAADRAAMNEQARWIADFEDLCRKRQSELKAPAKDKPYSKVYQEARELVERALAESWSASERKAVVTAIRTWLPEIEKVDDMRVIEKKLKFKQLLGEA